MLMVGGVMGGSQFHLNVIAMHPHQFNRFFNALFPLSGSFHTYLDQFMSIKNISDLKAPRGSASSQVNMDTTCFHSLENMYFWPLLQLGFICQMVEILYFVCSLLWNISLLLELYFHWKLEYFVILEHVINHVYHHVYCLPLYNIWEERT